MHVDVGDLCDDRLIAERVRNAAAGENRPRAARFGRRTRIPPIGLRRRFDGGNRAGTPESFVVGRARREKFQSEFDRVGLRCRRELVDERLGCKGRLRTVGIAEVARAQRRLPHERQADDLRGGALVRDLVHVRRRARAAAGICWLLDPDVVVRRRAASVAVEYDSAEHEEPDQKADECKD